ncbi:hypothetical protein RQ479_13000 [Mesorhizobium sp. ISC25]|uniref:hypothetical protein n=1 Tax=Mesorhizobium sp. ISC25 TaxID=3077335 RepID=UPI0035DC0ABE
MDKSNGDNLLEWLSSGLPEDQVIRADITMTISRKTDEKSGPADSVVTKARLDHSLVQEQEEADASVDHQPSVPLLLVLYVLSMLGLVGYALARSYFYNASHLWLARLLSRSYSSIACRHRHGPGRLQGRRPVPGHGHRQQRRGDGSL